MGDGWWIATDSKWYPPELHPDATSNGSTPNDPASWKKEGWWVASDGNWYAPEQHPDSAYRLAAALRADQQSAHPAGGGYSDEFGLPPSSPSPHGPTVVRRSDETYRSTIGGPISAVPPVSTRESDAFGVRSAPKTAKASKGSPRPRLASFTFLIVLVLVLGGAAAAILIIHH